MLLELVKKNRSYRGFNRNRRVSRQELLELVDAARLGASSVNLQPLKYYPAWEEEEVAGIQALTKWAAALPDLLLPHPGMEPTAFIVICQDTDISNATSRFLRDVGIAAQTILLAAVEKGLGGCMIGNFDPKKLQEKLGLPQAMIPMLVIAVGEPAEQVVLEEIEDGASTNYWRDEQDVHHVPKRRLEDIVLH